AQIPQPIRQGLPRPSGGFVLAVGQDTITSDDISGALMQRLTPLAQQSSYEQFVNQAMPVVAMALRDKVVDILLYERAKAAAPEEIDEQLDKAVESEMRRFIVSFGGDYAKAEEFLKNYYGMGWKEFRDHQRRMILSSSYLQGRLEEKKPVTYSQIRQYYDQHQDLYKKDPTVTIRLIDINTSLFNNEPNAGKQLADEVIKKLEAGENFGELAKQYSNGYRASTGGLWQPVNPVSLAEPYDILAEKAGQMQIGEIAGPIEKQGHIFIMKLEDKDTGTVAPFETVQAEIEQIILLERRRKSFDDVMDKIVEEAAISGLDEFALFCLQEIYQQANNQSYRGN
ncbi:MAG: peptidyl-prolyl cis-trans isomerase, partial [Phycisphaerae bacterium]